MTEIYPCFAYGDVGNVGGVVCVEACPLYDLSKSVSESARSIAAEQSGKDEEDITLNLRKSGELIQSLRALGQSISEESLSYCIRKIN